MGFLLGIAYELQSLVSCTRGVRLGRMGLLLRWGITKFNNSAIPIIWCVFCKHQYLTPQWLLWNIPFSSLVTLWVENFPMVLGHVFHPRQTKSKPRWPARRLKDFRSNIFFNWELEHLFFLQQKEHPIINTYIYIYIYGFCLSIS